MWRQSSLRWRKAVAAFCLLKRTGFDVPVFLFDQTSDETPDGVTAVINGKEQDWLELKPPPVIMKIICCRRFSIRYASMSR
jgi:hypothetical protein